MQTLCRHPKKKKKGWANLKYVVGLGPTNSWPISLFFLFWVGWTFKCQFHLWNIKKVLWCGVHINCHNKLVQWEQRAIEIRFHFFNDPPKKKGQPQGRTGEERGPPQATGTIKKI